MKNVVSGLIVATVLLGSCAHAAGFEFGDIGQVALGRGFAYAAKADSPEAFHYNPAGLSKLHGLHMSLGGTFVRASESFRRQGSGYVCRVDTYECLLQRGESGPNVYDPSRDEGPYALDPATDVNTGEPYTESSSRSFGPIPLPLFVVSYGDLGGIDSLNLGLGVTSPSSVGSSSFPRGGGQRYTLIESNIILAIVGLGLAWSPGPWLRVGGVFNAAFLRSRFSQATQTVASPRQSGDNELHADDVQVGIEVSDPFTPTATLGLMSQPLDFLEVGTSLRLPMRFEARGKASLSAPQSAPDLSLVGKGNVQVEQTLPLVLRVGVRYMVPRFDVELDYIYEHTGAIDAVPLKMEDVVVDNGQGDLVTFFDTALPMHFRDSSAVRLGGDVAVVPQVLDVRVGAFAAGTAYPDNYETFNVLFPYARQLGLNAGLSVRVWSGEEGEARDVYLHAGYCHVFQQSVTVTHGVAQQNVVRSSVEASSTGNIVNNGHYRASFDFIGLSASAHL